MADAPKITKVGYNNAMNIAQQRGLTYGRYGQSDSARSISPAEACKNTALKDTTISFGQAGKATGSTIDSIGNLLSRGLDKTIETIDSGLDKVAGWLQ